MSLELLEYLGTTATITGPGAAAATVAIKVLLYGLIFSLWRIVDTFDVARKTPIQLPQDYWPDDGQVEALTIQMPECRKHCLLSQLPKDDLDKQNNTNGSDLKNTNSKEFDCPQYLRVRDANENSGSVLFSNADTFQLMNELLSKLQIWFSRKKHRIFKHIEHVNLHSILLAN